MDSVLKQQLNLKREPVGIGFSDSKPDSAIEFPENKRTCVVNLLNSCQSGKVVAVTDETCSCVGGAVGLCFGDAFTRRNSHTDLLLSTGMTDAEAENLPAFYRHGERFFATPELARHWMASLPFVQASGRYALLAPLSWWNTDNPPSVVYLVVNPDQLSALVIMCGYLRGTLLNVVAPFASACQSILLAYHEIAADEPKAILGGFDLSQRNKFSKEELTLTMPFRLLQEIEKGISEGCLTTESWKRISERYADAL